MRFELIECVSAVVKVVLALSILFNCLLRTFSSRLPYKFALRYRCVTDIAVIV